MGLCTAFFVALINKNTIIQLLPCLWVHTDDCNNTLRQSMLLSVTCYPHLHNSSSEKYKDMPKSCWREIWEAVESWSVAIQNRQRNFRGLTHQAHGQLSVSICCPRFFGVSRTICTSPRLFGWLNTLNLHRSVLMREITPMGCSTTKTGAQEDKQKRSGRACWICCCSSHDFIHTVGFLRIFASASSPAAFACQKNGLD